VVSCQHDIREALQGGACLLAGLTYICEDDIASILEDNCIDIEYQGVDRIRDKRVCGRQLIDFLTGYPLETETGINSLIVVTGNDLQMLTPQCLLVDGHKLCWENEPVAKPFDFIANRCRVDAED